MRELDLERSGDRSVTERRQRARIVVAAYAICLVALLTFAAYLAPAEALGTDVDPPASSGTLQAR